MLFAMELFFSLEDELPADAGFSLWGGAHLTALALAAALIAGLCLGFRRASESGRRALRRGVGWAVLALELVNSAIERAVDKPDTTHWWTAGAAKDMAAGAVLVMALGTLVVAVCLLVPHFGTLWANFTLRPTRPAGIVLTLVIFTKFIFRSSNSTEKGKQPNGKTDS